MTAGPLAASDVRAWLHGEAGRKGKVMASGVEIVAAVADAWNRHDLEGVYGRMAKDYREYVNGALIRTSRDDARREDQSAL
jgi:hypothetical protein